MASSTLTACFIWFFVSMFLVTSCPIYDNCLQQLEALRSDITNGSADIVKPCVQLLQGNLPCFTEAFSQCKPKLDINAIINFRSTQDSVGTSCKEYCPIIEDVKSCSDNIDHGALGRSKTEFCRSYVSSFQCYKDKLDIKKCPIGAQLFAKLVDEDTLRIGRYICDTDCSDVDAATTALERCSNTVDKTNTSCSTYKAVQFCIKDASICQEATKMMPYYLPAFRKMEEKCTAQPTTTLTSPKELTTTIRPRGTTINEMEVDSLIRNCTKELQSNSDVCNTIHCMKDKNIQKRDITQDLIVKEPLLRNVINNWDMCLESTETVSIEKQTATQGSASQSTIKSTEPLIKSTSTYHQPSSSLDGSAGELSSSAEATVNGLTIEVSSIKYKKNLVTTSTTQSVGVADKDDSFMGTSDKVQTVSVGRTSTVMKTEEPKEAATLPLIPNLTTQKILDSITTEAMDKFTWDTKITNTVKLSTVDGLPSSTVRRTSTGRTTGTAKSQTNEDDVTSALLTSSVAQPKHTEKLSTDSTRTNTFSNQNTNIGHTSPESDGSTINSLESTSRIKSTYTTQERPPNGTPDTNTGQQKNHNGCEAKSSSLKTILLLLLLVIIC